MKKILLAIVMIAGVLPTLQARADFWDVVGRIVESRDRRPPPYPGRPGPGPGPVRPGPPGPGYPPGRPGYPPPPPPHYGERITCTYQDEGWEEHWRGHSSCGECLSRHGNCLEVCTAEFEVCDVDTEDWNGRRWVEHVRGRDRWEAEDRARSLCYSRNYRYCQVIRCNPQQERVSTRSCR